MIESLIIGWLTNQTSAVRRIYTGARIANSALPALVVRVNSSEQMSLGAITGAWFRYEFDVLAVDNTMLAAQTLTAAARAVLISESQADPTTIEVVTVSEGVLDEPEITDGDEQNYAVCTASYILWVNHA